MVRDLNAANGSMERSDTHWKTRPEPSRGSDGSGPNVRHRRGSRGSQFTARPDDSAGLWQI